MGRKRGMPDAGVVGERKCKACGEPFQPLRATRRYCSVRCRGEAHRLRSAQALAIEALALATKGLTRDTTI